MAMIQANWRLASYQGSETDNYFTFETDIFSLSHKERTPPSTDQCPPSWLPRASNYPICTEEKYVIQLANRIIISFITKSVIPLVIDKIAISPSNCSFITILLTLLSSFPQLLWEKQAQIKVATVQLDERHVICCAERLLIQHKKEKRDYLLVLRYDFRGCYEDKNKPIFQKGSKNAVFPQAYSQ